MLKNLFYRFLSIILRYPWKLLYNIWSNYPFGERPKGDKKQYIELSQKACLINYPEVDKYEKESGFSIDSKWLDNLALHTQVVIKESELCFAHGRVLYSTLSKYLSDNQTNILNDSINIWETGTARGFSSLCMAKALNDQNVSGKICTFDILPHDKKMYWNCIDDVEGPKTRDELLAPWKSLVEKYILFYQGDTRFILPTVKTGRINFAFLDGAHTYKDVLFEFSNIRKYQQAGDIIVYDDYSPELYPGLVRAVDEICDIHNYQRIDLNANSSRGYVVAIKK